MVRDEFDCVEADEVMDPEDALDCEEADEDKDPEDKAVIDALGVIVEGLDWLLGVV